MRKKRTLSRDITENESFLSLPLSSQALFLHLWMNADDDGFVVHPEVIAQSCGAKQKDIKILETMNFLLNSQNVHRKKVIKLHGFREVEKVRKDRYEKSEFAEITREVGEKEGRKKHEKMSDKMSDKLSDKMSDILRENTPSKTAQNKPKSPKFTKNSQDFDRDESPEKESTKEKEFNVYFNYNPPRDIRLRSYLSPPPTAKSDFSQISIPDDTIVNPPENLPQDIDGERLNRSAHIIISYLNKKTGRRFKPNAKKHMALIKSLLDEGYTIDDFLKAIDNKTETWLNDPEYSKFLRPSTLFGPLFDEYLNEIHAEARSDKNQNSKLSSFDTHDAFVAALKKSYGDDYDKFFGDDFLHP